MTLQESIDNAVNQAKQATGQGLFDVLTGAIKTGLTNNGVNISNVTPQPSSTKKDTIAGVDSKYLYIGGALIAGYFLFKKFGKRRV